MTKTTTKTSLFAIILSWTIAIMLSVGLVLLLSKKTDSDKSGLSLADKKDKITRNLDKKSKTQQRKENIKRKTEETKKDQSLRPLPPENVKQLVKQSEIFVKKQLLIDLKRFQEITEKMIIRKNNFLRQVEKRKLPASASRDANNTSSARNIPKTPSTPLGQNASVKDLYERLRQYEKEAQQNNLAISAAIQSLSKGLSFPEVYKSLKLGTTQMSDFDQLVDNQTGGKGWKRSEMSNASSGLQISTTEDLNNYRGVLGQASRQSSLAQTRLEGLFEDPQSGGNGKKPAGGPGSEGGKGDGSGDGGMSVSFKNTSGNKTPMSNYQGPRLNEKQVKANALPGRRFSKSASRKGWLYINTWYMIGPWENFGKDDFSIIHPPELSIDLDAVYTDGQIGRGIAETESDPLQIVGNEVKLDGTLRWKFMQSESMHNTVPVTTDHSTYYAYTELYFDEATDMLVALGTDDSGRVWINGKDVWQDKGTSWYHIDEYIVSFRFQKGWNKILFRLENAGGGATGISFLICPKEAVSKSMIDK